MYWTVRGCKREKIVVIEKRDTHTQSRKEREGQREREIEKIVQE